MGCTSEAYTGPYDMCAMTDCDACSMSEVTYVSFRLDIGFLKISPLVRLSAPARMHNVITTGYRIRYSTITTIGAISEKCFDCRRRQAGDVHRDLGVYRHA